MKHAGSCVLVVDDEPDMIWALQNLLTVHGFEARTAQTGEAALQLLETIEFATALLDVKLSDMDGLELARRIKTIAPSINIIMISGYYYRDDVDIQGMVQEGLVVGFISKPFRHEDVIRMLQT
jgi:CheY-like chemotaxis protein